MFESLASVDGFIQLLAEIPLETYLLSLTVDVNLYAK